MIQKLLKPFVRDITIIAVGEAFLLLGFFILYRLVRNQFGPEGVGEYSLLRKVVGFLQPLLFLGLGIGIPRYIAMAAHSKERAGYMTGASIVLVAWIAIMLGLLNLFDDAIAVLLFGSEAYQRFVFPLSLFLGGLLLHGLVYSYLRGRLATVQFTFLQIINIVLWPGIVFFWGGAELETLFVLIGGGMIFIAFLFFVRPLMEMVSHFVILKWDSYLKTLFLYSIWRVPGDFFQAGLFSLGPIIAAHVASIEEVGYLAIGQGLLAAGGTAIVPLGIFLLPKVSQFLAQKKDDSVQMIVDILAGAIIQGSVFLALNIIVFADIIIFHWLGPEFFNAVPIIRLVAISLLFYVLYGAWRSILDAIKTKPINSINLFISLLIFVLFVVLFVIVWRPFPAIIGLAGASTASLLCLGTLTYISLRTMYRGYWKDFMSFVVALAVSAFLFGIAIGARPLLWESLPLFIGFEAGLGILYLFILWVLRPEWLKLLIQLIKS